MTRRPIIHHVRPITHPEHCAKCRMFIPEGDPSSIVTFTPNNGTSTASFRLCWPCTTATVSDFERGPGPLVDTHQAPYTVPCPKCHAWALQACHDGVRPIPVPGTRGDPFPPDAKALSEPHAERWDFWQAKPEYRVVVVVVR